MKRMKTFISSREIKERGNFCRLNIFKSEEGLLGGVFLCGNTELTDIKAYYYSTIHSATLCALSEKFNYFRLLCPISSSFI